MKTAGYEPAAYIQRDPALARAIAAIASGEFSPGEPQRYRHITDELQRRDGYLLMADFGDYVQAQSRVDTLFGAPERWTSTVVANIAAMGEFSSGTARCAITSIGCGCRCGADGACRLG